MPINARAAGDSRHARTGKDGAFYNKDGVMLASVETFTSNVTWNNAKYNVLGDPQEHETSASYAVNLTMTQVVVEDDQFIVELFEAMESGITPCWDFQGTLTGLNGSEERVVYTSIACCVTKTFNCEVNSDVLTSACYSVVSDL